MLARKTIFAVAAAATVCLAVPAMAGEGSPDTELGPYGNWGSGPTYPYVAPNPGPYMTGTYSYPAPPPYSGYPTAGYYEPDHTVGYVPRSRGQSYELD